MAVLKVLYPDPNEPKRRVSIRLAILNERMSSYPYFQFIAQVNREEERIIQKREGDGTTIPDHSVCCRSLAYEKVKHRWVKQGIWDNSWDGKMSGPWKHEVPLNVAAEVGGIETPMALPAETTIKQGEATAPQQVTPPVTEQEKREHEASRPSRQFVAQLHKELKFLKKAQRDKPATKQMKGQILKDTAYENVNQFWVGQKIWRKCWEYLPGERWVHEEDLEAEVEKRFVAEEKDGKLMTGDDIGQPRFLWQTKKELRKDKEHRLYFSLFADEIGAEKIA